MLSLAEFWTLLPIFIARLQDEVRNNPWETNQSLNKSAKANGREAYQRITTEEGKRFVKVFEMHGLGSDITKDSGLIKYFVEKATGVIFDAKSIKAYNPNHEYGTLETIDEWDWSGYRAVNKTGKPSLVPKALRR